MGTYQRLILAGSRRKKVKVEQLWVIMRNGREQAKGSSHGPAYVGVGALGAHVHVLEHRAHIGATEAVESGNGAGKVGDRIVGAN